MSIYCISRTDTQLKMFLYNYNNALCIDIQFVGLNAIIDWQLVMMLFRWLNSFWFWNSVQSKWNQYHIDPMFIVITAMWPDYNKMIRL